MSGEGRAPTPPQDWDGLLAALPSASWVVDLDRLEVIAANRAAIALLGGGQATLAGRRADDLIVTPEDLAWWSEAGAAGPLDSQTLVVAADGRALPVRRTIRLLPTRPPQALVTLIDLAPMQEAESARDVLLAELQATLDSTADGVLVLDDAGRVRSFNRRFVQLWSVPDSALTARDGGALGAWLLEMLADGADWPPRESTERLRLRNGRVLDCVSQPLVARGRVQGRVHSFRDLTERLSAHRRIDELERTDLLTGLPNRAHLADRVAEAAGGGRGGFALLVVDLDRFRQINESLGHDTGDRVLIDIARRIQGCLRQDDLLARTGGDQFTLLVHQADMAAAETAARRVLSVVARTTEVDGATFTLTCSIGVALAPSHGRTLDELMPHAEAAMRAVKAGGRASFRLHQARAAVDLRQHMKLDHAMRLALASGRFRLHFQPQVRLADGATVGAEALIRWRDPELGEVAPNRFIPVAEDSGFIVEIGDWVLAQAARQASAWLQRGLTMPVAVNVSALQFHQSHFVDRVAAALKANRLPPALLELELTESILVHDADDALARLHALARLGVQLSIDDFGTGYSSLAYLKRFPIGKLKIDRSFVRGLPDDDSDAGIVRAILQMARALDKKVVAEGVETEAQRRFLQASGCDEFQGFLVAPALDSLSFEQRLAESAGQPAPAPARPAIRLVRN